MSFRTEFNWLATRLYRRLVENQPLQSGHTHLLVACQPKSGSTYLTRILGSLPDFSTVTLVPGYGRREQELDPGMLSAMHNSNYVAHHHVRYSEPMAKLIRQFEIRPIVLVRDIFDTVISLRDHFRLEGVDGPMGVAYPHMTSWEDPKLELFIVRMLLPWYFNFYLTWLDCEQKCMIRYEELNREPLAVLEQINSYYALGFEKACLADAVAAAQHAFTRKNKAIVGRGQQLEEQTRLHVYQMAAFYDGIDFSPLGILPEDIRRQTM